MDALTLQSDLVQVNNQWDPPLKAEPQNVTSGVLSGKGHFSSTPKMWPSDPSSLATARKKSERDATAVNTKHLDRAAEREVAMWRDIARKAKSERMMIGSKNGKKSRPKSATVSRTTTSSSASKYGTNKLILLTYFTSLVYKSVIKG